MLSDWVDSLGSKIEPEAAELDGSLSDDRILAISMAISLKRIADTLTGEGLAELLRTPVNNYGESFTDAIQMSMVRGQRGDDRT